MKLSEIKPEEVLEGKSWIVDASQDEGDPLVRETLGFERQDVGLFSAAVRIADGTEHLALVVKSFPQGGDEIDIYMYTKAGWLNIHAEGFMRALGKYSHDLFPFDYFVADPWKGGAQPVQDRESPHRRLFKEMAVRVRERLAGWTQFRRRP